MGVIAEELKIRARWDGQDLETGVKRVGKGIDATRDSAANLNRVLRTAGQLFGLAFGVETIRRLGAYAQASVVLAAKLDSTSQAFERMAVKAGKNAAGELQRLREYTKGTISDLELLQRVGAAVDSGLTFEQSATAVRFLRAYSTAFGKDFNQLMSTVFTGLQRGSTLMLDDAGIIISQTDKMFDGMSELEKKSALVGEAIRKMSEKLPDLETNGINAAEAADQLAVKWAAFRVQLGEILEPISQVGIALGSSMVDRFGEVAEAVVGTSNVLQDEMAKLRQAGGSDAAGRAATHQQKVVDAELQVLELRKQIGEFRLGSGFSAGDVDYIEAFLAPGGRPIAQQLDELREKTSVFRQELVGIKDSAGASDLLKQKLKEIAPIQDELIQQAADAYGANKRGAIGTFTVDPELAKRRDFLLEQIKVLKQTASLFDQLDEANASLDLEKKGIGKLPEIVVSAQKKIKELPENFKSLNDPGVFRFASPGYLQPDLPDVSQYVDFLDQIKMAEAQASGDRIQIIEAEHQIRVRKATEAALAIEGGERLLSAFIVALEQQKTRAINEEEENRTSKEELAARTSFLRDVERAELQATGNREAIRKAEVQQFIEGLAQKAESLEDIIRLNKLWRDMLNQIEKEETIKKVLLVFNADASQVEDASDLGAYSVGLFVESLRKVSPALSTVVDGLEQIWSGVASGGLAGGIAAGAGFAFTQIIADSAKWKAEVERLNKELADAAELTGSYARSLEDLNVASLKQQFQDLTGGLGEQLGFAWENMNWSQFVDFEDFTTDTGAAFEAAIDVLMRGTGMVMQDSWVEAQELTVRTTFEHLGRMGEAIRRFSGETFTFQQALDDFTHIIRLENIEDPTQKLSLLEGALAGIVDISQGLDSDLSDLGLRDRRRILEMIADLERSKAEVEIEAREEQAQTIIASIQRQQTEVQRVLDDQMEAQRQATLRSVKLRYDFVEAELRQKYLPLLSGAGGDTAQRALVMGDLEREIEILRESERAYGEDQLALLREKFDAQRELEDRTTELLIEAVQNASKQSDVALETAIQQQTSALMAQWVDSLGNTVLGKPVLPSELIDLRTQVLLEMSSIVNPVGVRAIDLASALEPIGVHPVDLLSALELQGVKFVNVQELLQPVGIRLVDLSQALGLTGEQVVDLAEALRLAGQIEVLVPDHFTPTGQQTINVVDFYSLTGHVDVPMSTAINPVGARIIPLDAALSPAGTRTVDLSGALSPMGERGVDLSHALRPEGQRVVDLAEALRLTGSFNVPADQVLQMTGISSQMAAQISVLDEIRLYTWATQYHLGTAVLSGGFSGGGSVVNNMVDLSETNAILRDIAAINASMLSLQFARRSVLDDIDIGAIGGFQGFLQMADLIGRNLPSYDGGGTVPGPAGAPQLAWVHGGETVYPPGQGPQQSVKQVIEVRVEFSGPVVEVRAQGGGVNYKDVQRQIIQDLNDGKLRKEVGDMISSAINSAIRKAG